METPPQDPDASLRANPPDSNRAGGRLAWLALAVVLIAEVMDLLDSTIITIAAPTVRVDLGGSTATMQWWSAAYTMAFGIFLIVGGRLGDMFGRRRVLIVVLAAGLVGSIVSFSAPSLWLLVVGRGLQGFAAGSLPLCFGLLREYLPARRVPLAISLVAGVVAICAGVGGLIAGILIDLGGWRPIFGVAAVFGALAIVVAALAVSGGPGMLPRPQVDVLGGVLLVPACAGLLVGATFADDWGWTDARVLGAFAIGVVSVALWVWWERRTPEPMANLALFRHRKIMLTTLATLAVGIGMMGSFSLLQPIVFQLPASAPVGLGLSASATGGIGLATAFVAYGGSALGGRFAGRYGARWPLLSAFVLCGVGALLWTFLNKDLAGTVVVVTLTSTASAVALASLPTLVVEVVPEANTGEATGMNRLTLNISVAIGIALSSMLLTSSTVPGTTLPAAAGLTTALLAMIGFAVVGVLLALAIGRGRRSAQPEPESQPQPGNPASPIAT
jgi:MFS family permease